jgi:hypothetical protein
MFAGYTGTYILRYREQPIAGTPLVDNVNNLSRFRFVASAGAQVGNLRGQVTWQHSGGFAVNPNIYAGQSRVGAFNLVNLFFKYDAFFLYQFNTEVPAGYKHDYINAEALLTLLCVRNGRVVTSSGMSYAVLFMPDHVRRFTLPVIRRLRELVKAGATWVGSKPVGGLGIASPIVRSCASRC